MCFSNSFLYAKSVAKTNCVGFRNTMLDPAHSGKHKGSAMKLWDLTDAMWFSEGWVATKAFRTF